MTALELRPQHVRLLRREEESVLVEEVVEAHVLQPARQRDGEAAADARLATEEREGVTKRGGGLALRSARWEARTAMKRVRPTPVGERKKHVRKLDAPAPSRRQLTMTAGGRKVLDASSCGVSAEAAAYAVRTAVLPALSACRLVS